MMQNIVKLKHGWPLWTPTTLSERISNATRSIVERSSRSPPTLSLSRICYFEADETRSEGHQCETALQTDQFLRLAHEDTVAADSKLKAG